jgi:hypothetical protein
VNRPTEEEQEKALDQPITETKEEIKPITKEGDDYVSIEELNSKKASPEGTVFVAAYQFSCTVLTLLDTQIPNIMWLSRTTQKGNQQTDFI